VPAERSRVHLYVFAITTVIAAAAGRVMAHAWASDALPFLTFFVSVIAASWYGGGGPGMLATALSAVAAYWLVPGERLGITAGAVMGTVPRFVVVGAVVASLLGRLHRARQLSAEHLASQRESLQRADFAQRQLAAIVESSDDAIVGIDVEGAITSWNRGAEHLYGYTAGEAVGGPMTLVVAPDRLDEEDRLLARIRTGERMEHFETERVRKDRSRVDVSITMSPIRDAGGAIVGASRIARDITERRRADRLREELLERERRALAETVAARDRLAFLADVSAMLTSSLDYQETLDRAVHLALPRLGDYCNVLVEDELGQLRHVACGHVVREKEPAVRELARLLVEDPSRSNTPAFAQTVLTTGTPLIVNHDAMTKALGEISRDLARGLVKLTGEVQPYAYLGVPLLVRGRAIGVMSFGTGERESAWEYSDVDAALVEEFARRVSLAIENARLFRQADELNRLKDEFLATLSHELRTPLAAVLGWSRMLGNGQLDPDKAMHAIRAIERNAQAQAQIVDDILDVARGMAGNLRLNVQRIDLVTVTHRGVEAIAPGAAAKNIDVQVHAPHPVPVVGDAGRLQQVVWNLLSNAVKFTEATGRIAIDVAGRNAHAELSVTDTGVGIASAFLPYVFDKFRQADGSFTRQHGGLGLGLAIARHLVELHGGSIEARSEGEGYGASFVVRLPLAS